MKHETVTYEVVRTEINKLHFEGEKISVRNVLNKTGGSFAKISDYIKRWKDERRILRDDTISENLTLAIKKEINDALKSEIAAKNQALDSVTSLLEESKSIITEYEAKICDYDEIQQKLLLAQEDVNKLETKAKKLMDDYIKLASENKVLNQKLETSTNAVVGLEQKMAALVIENGEAQKGRLIYKTEAEQLQKQLTDLYSKFKIS
jgi:chromosome segregation ATPase